MFSQRFIVEYNYNSNHIEGNTLTYGQTELLLLFGKVSGEGELNDFADMRASLVGMEMMQQEAASGNPLTQNFIRQLHKTILREDYTKYVTLPNGVQTSYTIHAGCYKTRPNSVITREGKHFEYASPEETPVLMMELVDWYNKAERSGEYAPAELAALFHYRYIRIHPFEDGNGRIARLLMNYVLLRQGFPMVVIRNRSKNEYLDALHRSDVRVGDSPYLGARAELGKIGFFLRYIKNTVAEDLKYAIDFLCETSPDVWWYDGQRVAFRSPASGKILRTIQQYPDCTVSMLVQRAGITKASVNQQLNRMASRGYIQRSVTHGSWYVFISPSV